MLVPHSFEDDSHSDVENELHAHRRIIAAYHQEIEFCSQGDDVYRWAAEDRAVIWAGAFVNRREFRKIYGF
ncbi:hypothetical protein DENSPDRAFT_789704 [Dentipellis sp. KUC8613]|nr:hypothetical protein DENSPDRAFT_789704 [Dentipellis sp. KUC8613]